MILIPWLLIDSWCSLCIIEDCGIVACRSGIFVLLAGLTFCLFWLSILQSFFLISTLIQSILPNTSSVLFLISLVDHGFSIGLKLYCIVLEYLHPHQSTCSDWWLGPQTLWQKWRYRTAETSAAFLSLWTLEANDKWRCYNPLDLQHKHIRLIIKHDHKTTPGNVLCRVTDFVESSTLDIKLPLFAGYCITFSLLLGLFSDQGGLLWKRLADQSICSGVCCCETQRDSDWATMTELAQVHERFNCQVTCVMLHACIRLLERI